MNTQQTGNQYVSGDFLKVLLALKKNVMRDIASSDLAIVTKVSQDTCACQLLTNTKTIAECVVIQNLDVRQNDVVLITFTKTDFRQNLKRYKQNQVLIENTSETLHSVNYGVITALIYRKENSN